MIAIVNIAGQQFKVTEGQELFVHQLEAAAGSSVSFDQVLMIDNNGSVASRHAGIEQCQSKCHCHRQPKR
jgi:large subunit ribosomal protein L21